MLEATDHAGGAVHSDESVYPGFISDLFSSFYPLGAASPILAALDLARHGLRWTHSPTVFAHVTSGALAGLLLSVCQLAELCGFGPAIAGGGLHCGRLSYFDLKK